MLNIGGLMNKLTLKRNLLKVKQGEIQQTQLSASFLRSSELERLIGINAIVRMKKGRGFVYSVGEEKAFDDYMSFHFPGINEDGEGERSANVTAYRDSKVQKRTSEQIMLVRSGIPCFVDGIAYHQPSLDSPVFYTLHGRNIKEIAAKKICVVENLESFLVAERILGTDALFVHTYGRMGKDLASKLTAETIVHWGDYDLVGLNEYALIKAVHPNTIMHIPDDIAALTEKYGRPADTLQKKSGELEQLLRCDPVAQQVFKIWSEKGLFLEQEALHGN
jgi:hypothetical protein